MNKQDQKKSQVALKHLIHIGYPKACSTYLQAWFKAHPQLLIDDTGIAGFHSALDLNISKPAITGILPSYYVTSKEAYSIPFPSPPDPFTLEEIFNNTKNADEILRNRQTHICRILADILPNSKVLIIVRKPKFMLQSIHSDYLMLGGYYDLHSFTTWLQSYLRQWLDFESLISQYEHYFGKENILTLPIELLQENSENFLHLITSFLNIDPFNPDFGPKNIGISDDLRNWMPIFAQGMLTLTRHLPNPIRTKLQFAYCRQIIWKNRIASIVKFMKLLHLSPNSLNTVPKELLNEFEEISSQVAHRPYLSSYATNQ